MPKSHEWWGYYPGMHHDRCMCKACEPIHKRHNSKTVCHCNGCATRNADLLGRTIKVATVNFCERCNSMGKSSAMGSIHYATDRSKPQEGIEVCPDCVVDFIKFLKETPVGERKKAYNEPYSEKKSDPLADVSDEELARAFLRREAEKTVRELEG